MRDYFRVAGWLEGFSLLALFFYAMPLKYYWNEPEMVRPIGAAHGVLFLAYMALAFALSEKENWKQKKLLVAFILSMLPLGTFIFEKKYLSKSA